MLCGTSPSGFHASSAPRVLSASAMRGKSTTAGTPAATARPVSASRPAVLQRRHPGMEAMSSSSDVPLKNNG